MTYQPKRDFLSTFFDTVLSSLGKWGGATKDGFTVYARPAGNYSGRLTTPVTRDSPIVTNPWGVAASFGPSFVGNSQYLAPGQSYNYVTGQLSDPKLHANTAARLNEAVNQRAVNEAGLTAASYDNARQGPSVLAALDQMYFANQATSVTTSQPLSAFAEINQQGTILGKQPPISRGQLKSSGR